MKKKGYEIPSTILMEAVQSYDLKIFRWVQKIGVSFPASQSIEVIQENMLSGRISKEKIRWLAERGKKNIHAYQITNLSLQAAQLLASYGDSVVPWEDAHSSDPRLTELIKKMRRR
jgi:hypothetical protein